MKLSNKRFSIIFLITFVVLLSICVSWVVIIDPFVYYHKPLFGMHTIRANGGYQNAGFIRNYDYETAIVGTSMTEQIRASEVDEVFDTKTIKICGSGAYTLDIALYLNEVCDTGKANRVIVGLDANLFRKPSDIYRYAHTLYMFDNSKSIFSDVQYLLNQEIIVYNCTNMLIQNARNNYIDLDDFYILDDSRFSKSITLEEYILPEDADNNSYDYSQVDANINNILSVIQNNEDIQFYVFMPPYSILYWYTQYTKGNIQNELVMHKKIIESFIDCENVKFYYFMDDEEIITDLNNYRDAGHYSPKVCSKLIEMMDDKRKEHLITKDNYLDTLEKMRFLAETYTYEKIFQD